MPAWVLNYSATVVPHRVLRSAHRRREHRSRFAGRDNGCSTTGTQHVTLEVVALLVDAGRWRAGTIGTIVEADADEALVDISDGRGHALDFIAVPQGALAAAPDDTRRWNQLPAKHMISGEPW
jgi:hypothetical protein